MVKVLFLFRRPCQYMYLKNLSKILFTYYPYLLYDFPLALITKSCAMIGYPSGKGGANPCLLGINTHFILQKITLFCIINPLFTKLFIQDGSSFFFTCLWTPTLTVLVHKHATKIRTIPSHLDVMPPGGIITPFTHFQHTFCSVLCYWQIGKTLVTFHLILVDL